MSSKFWIAPIKGYQYISKMLPAGCRYYPTCSEYAKWSFETSPAHIALYHSSLRILSCNPLFDGGIDYPLITYKVPSCIVPYTKTIRLKYWFVPKIQSPTKYFVIGVLDSLQKK